MRGQTLIYLDSVHNTCVDNANYVIIFMMFDVLYVYMYMHVAS